uniref:IST1-like protein n=1 Tax=Fagus sylvatica TaxID=28930 RepID=A0A2N9IH70_FAGSY
MKEAQLRLTIQKNRKDSIIRQSRADIAQLLQIGQLEQALIRVDKLFKDQNLSNAYNQINDFCECIITNFPHISKQSAIQSLPIDVRQALANVIFAASRCGELPELNMLRRYFRKRYGCEFETVNVELRHENLVTPLIKQNLCKYVVPDDEKLKLISEIAEEHTLGYMDSEQSPTMQCHKKYSLFSSNYNSEQRAEVLDLDMPGPYSDNDEFSTQARAEYWEDLSARTSSDGMPRTPEMNCVYLDDIEEKSVNQAGCKLKNGCTRLDSWDGHASSLANKSTIEETALPNIQYSRPSSKWKSVRKKTSNMVQDQHSIHASNDEAEKDSQSCMSHVHSKLPNYEDVVTKFMDMKVEHRQRNSFSYY